MSSMEEGDSPLDDLEVRWQSVSENLRNPQKQLKSFNTDLLLRNFRKSVFELEQRNKTRPYRAINGSGNKTYTEKEVVEFWEEVKRHQDLQRNPKALKLLVKESLYKGIRSILEDSQFLLLFPEHTNILLSPLWLRRYYFFYFDTLYLSEEKRLTELWGKILGLCFEHLKKEGSLYRNGAVKVRYASLFKTLNITVHESEGLKTEVFEEYMETLLHLAPSSAMEDINSLEQYFRQSLGFDLLPAGIRRYCQKHLFNIHFSKYLNDINDTACLTHLLEQFCPLDTSFGQDHLASIVTEAYGGPNSLRKLPSPLRVCIQSYLIKTIKDPRLNNAAWGSMRTRHKHIYDGLRYWFVEADFDLFFEYAFRHSRDDHKRKKLWGKFLKQVHDFRVFLPSHSFHEIQSQLKDENRHAQVYKNFDNITGFILCIENLVIYEAVETGNAAYIYDINELETLASPDAKRVMRFLTHLFENNSTPGYMGTRSALANTYLAPKPDEWDGKTKSRRFTHDRNAFWHDQVLSYLERNYLIVPDRPE